MIYSLFKKKKNNIIDKYTDDLTKITSDLHSLQKKLNSNSTVLSTFKIKLLSYLFIFLTILILLFFLNNNDWNFMILLLIAEFLLFLLLIIILNFYHNFKIKLINKKIAKLRVKHSKIINSLIKDTNFYSTNNLINRFTSGDLQSDDSLLLINDELNKKKNELKLIKNELNSLYLKKKNFLIENDNNLIDKFLNYLSNNNDNLPFLPILCKNCKKFNGIFILKDKYYNFICPICNFNNILTNENNDNEYNNNNDNKTIFDYKLEKLFENNNNNKTSSNENLNSTPLYEDVIVDTSEDDEDLSDIIDTTIDEIKLIKDNINELKDKKTDEENNKNNENETILDSNNTSQSNNEDESSIHHPDTNLRKRNNK